MNECYNPWICIYYQSPALAVCGAGKCKFSLKSAACRRVFAKLKLHLGSYFATVLFHIIVHYTLRLFFSVRSLVFVWHCDSSTLEPSWKMKTSSSQWWMRWKTNPFQCLYLLFLMLKPKCYCWYFRSSVIFTSRCMSVCFGTEHKDFFSSGNAISSSSSSRGWIPAVAIFEYLV